MDTALRSKLGKCGYAGELSASHQERDVLREKNPSVLIDQKAARLHKTVGIKPQSSGLQVATPNDSYSPNKYLTQAPFNAAPFAVRLTAAPRTGNANF